MGLTTSATATLAVHPFERAGLGTAPFRCTGYFESVFQAIPGDPSCPVQPGTTCDYCGQGIRHAYRIVGADGRTFKVGSDCVRRTKDTRLCTVVTAAERDARHAQEAAKVEAARTALADPEVRARLAAKPHPKAGEKWAVGKSMLDWADWMMAHAGTRGRLAVLRAIEVKMA